MDEVKSTRLKTEFFTAVTVTILTVAAASALTVWGCLALRGLLAPDANYVMLEIAITGPGGVESQLVQRFEVDGDAQRVNFLESPTAVDPSPAEAQSVAVRVRSVDYGTGLMGPRRKLAYTAAGAAMGVLPASYALAGTLLCSVWFYRRKLAPAIEVLDGAARHIMARDLDFTVECPAKNELGRLCVSFERMRAALYENNVRLWRALEERRMLGASVAHDLRNPLAIMEGTLERIGAEAREGTLTNDSLGRRLADLEAAARRMERYTDCIRDLGALEDTPVSRRSVELPEFLERAAGSLEPLAQGRGIDAPVRMDVPRCRAALDPEIFYRVLENTFSNALRYAASRVELTFTLRGGVLTVRVADDGPGFPPEMLKTPPLLPRGGAGGHMGLGLPTGRLLAEKHGGGLRLSNSPSGGAAVEFTLAVEIDE